MKAISLWQPWASALFAPYKGDQFHAIKLYETRHWKMPVYLHNEWVAIHAAKRDTKAEREFWEDIVCENDDYQRAFIDIGILGYAALPRGSIIGKARFGPSQATSHYADWKDVECDWGNYSPGRYAWPVIEKELFTNPIPCVGRQGFFDVQLP